MIGRQIGSYNIQKQLGKGAMGSVWLASNSDSKGDGGDKVAIKLLQRTDDQEFVKRFYREKKILATLKHKNIAKFLDEGEFNGQPYIVMEYVPGITLKEVLLNRNYLPIEKVLDITRQLCAGLSEAHSKQIIHRDIKPANIMLVESGGEFLVKILDFGIAKVRSVSGSDMTMSGFYIGTAEYMSPEQAKGTSSDNEIDARSDVYSVGILVYEMLTGRKPFSGSSEEIRRKHQFETPPLPSVLRTDIDIPLAIENSIIKALAKDRGSRQESVDAFYQEIKLGIASNAESLDVMDANLSVFCVSHNFTFQVSRQAGIIRCESSQARHAFDGEFPWSGLWAYCCGCERVIVWKGKENVSTHQCPFCKRREHPRVYVCDQCAVITLDFAGHITKRLKRFSVLEWGMPQPNCPGCFSPPQSPPQKHYCKVIQANLATSLDICPFCLDNIGFKKANRTVLGNEGIAKWRVIARKYELARDQAEKKSGESERLITDMGEKFQTLESMLTVMAREKNDADEIIEDWKNKYKQVEARYAELEFNYQTNQLELEETKVSAKAAVSKASEAILQAESKSKDKLSTFLEVQAAKEAVEEKLLQLESAYSSLQLKLEAEINLRRKYEAETGVLRKSKVDTEKTLTKRVSDVEEKLNRSESLVFKEAEQRRVIQAEYAKTQGLLEEIQKKYNQVVYSPNRLNGKVSRKAKIEIALLVTAINATLALIIYLLGN